jgi:hypothetical protein
MATLVITKVKTCGPCQYFGMHIQNDLILQVKKKSPNIEIEITEFPDFEQAARLNGKYPKKFGQYITGFPSVVLLSKEDWMNKNAETLPSVKVFGCKMNGGKIIDARVATHQRNLQGFTDWIIEQLNEMFGTKQQINSHINTVYGGARPPGDSLADILSEYGVRKAKKNS